jgi:hypothetical protein
VEGVTRRLAVVGSALLLASCGEQPSVEYEGPYASDVRAAMVKIERITGKPFTSPPRVATRARADVRAIMEREFEQRQGESLPFQETAFKLLGLIPQSLDLRALMLELLDEQVLGFYLPQDSTLYLVDDAPAELRVGILTHELVHALQGQYVNLDSILRIEGNEDRVISAQALMEGQASWVMMSAMGRFVSVEQQRALVRQRQAEMPEFASAPLFVQEIMIFPYLSGFEFVRQYLDSHSAESLLESAAIPTSTEQVLHWDRYTGERDAATYVTLPPPRTGTVVYDSNLGEFGTRLLLFLQSNEQSTSISGAQGWDGDRYLVVRTPRGDGIVWLTIWDSTVEAAEFGSAMRRAIDRRFSTPSSRRLPDGSTTFDTDSRSLRLWGGTVSGRAAVLYVDMPRGIGTEGVDLARVALEEID